MADELLVAIGGDASTPGTTLPRKTSRRVSGTWDTQVLVTGTVASEPRIHCLTDDLWFTFNDFSSSPFAYHWGPGSRSKDGGDTWEATPMPGGGIIEVGAITTATITATDIRVLTIPNHEVVAGDNRLLIVRLSTRSPDDTWIFASTVKFGGVDLTNDSMDVGFETFVSAEIWYLVAPAVSTADIVITIGGDNEAIIGAAQNFTGVRQSTPMRPFGGKTYKNAGDNAPSVDVSSIDPVDLVIDALGTHDTNPVAATTAGAEQVEDSNLTETGSGGKQIRLSTSHEIGDGRVTMSWATSGTPSVSLVAAHLVGVGGGILDIARAADGRLWAIVHTDIDSVKTHIYYSDDDGDTWVESTTHGGSTQSNAWGIACHPTDPDTIAVIGFSFDMPDVDDLNGYILSTTDQGDNWSVNYDADLWESFFGATPWHDIVMLSTGRLIICGIFDSTFPYSQKVYITDDFGATITLAHLEEDGQFLMPPGIFVSPDESTIAIPFADGFSIDTPPVELWISTDSGSNFSYVPLATEPEDFGFSAFASDGDTIYLGTLTSKIFKLTPVSADGVWTQIDAGFPHGEVDAGFLGITPKISTDYTHTVANDGGIVFSGDSVDISVNIPETPDPEDTIIVFAPKSAIFRGSPSGAIRRLIKLG